MTEKELYDRKSREHYALALNYLERGRLRRARRHFRMAQGFGFNSEQVLYQLGLIRKYQSRMDSAMEVFNILLSNTESPAPVYLQVGSIYRILGTRKAALENYRLALKKQGDYLTRTLALREVDNLGILNKADFLRLIELSLGKAGNSEESVEGKRADAILTFLRDDSRSAFLKLRALIHAHPDHAELYRDLAWLHFKKHNYKLAVRALLKAQARLPRDQEIGYLLGHALFRLGAYPESRKALRDLARCAKRNPALFVNLGNIHVRNGHNVSAIKAYKRALVEKDDYFPALFNLATLYHETGEPETALRYYEQAREVLPDNHYVHYNLGILYYETGDHLAAYRAYGTCLEIRPDFKPAERNLKFVMLAKVCYPEAGPEEKLNRWKRYYWLGFSSVLVVILFTILRGWI